MTACLKCGGTTPRMFHAYHYPEGPGPQCWNCAPAYKRWSETSGAGLCQREVSKAIRRGELTRAAEHRCVDCGKQARDWDHRDYNKPLDVEPVCHRCNILRGPAIHRKAA